MFGIARGGGESLRSRFSIVQFICAHFLLWTAGRGRCVGFGRFFFFLHAFKRNVVTETNAHVSVAKMIKIYYSV